MKAMIVCPSAPINNTTERRARFDRGVEHLKTLMDVEMAAHVLGENGYVSASTEGRVSDLLQAFADWEVDVLVAGTGGWNCGHVLESLPWDQLKGKPLAGFSDISVLQNALYAHGCGRQLLGPMVNWGFCEGEEFTLQSFRQAVKGDAQVYRVPDFGEWWKGDTLDGALVGGNLVSLATLLGTPHAPDWRGKVFFWEETEEELYRLDRALTHFKNAGVWSQISGMVIGKLDQIGETFGERTRDTNEMIREHFARYDFPILKTELSGHHQARMVTLEIGGRFVATNREVRIGGPLEEKKRRFMLPGLRWRI